MTKPTLRRLPVALLATAALSGGAALPAQTVLLHEVRADAGGSWIELMNRSQAPVDLSTWSLHYASKTPGMPRNYWWAFPAGTVLPPGGLLLVHWYQEEPAGGGAPGELWTGATLYDFLFGLGGEPLLGTRGALALLRTQANEWMNSSAVVEDWVSWGESAFPREPLAVQAGRWTAGRFAPAIPAGASLARDPVLVGQVAFHDLEWFVDASPTPLAVNTTGALVQSYGTACALPGNHLLGVPVLRTTSLPLVGNGAFGFAIDHTTGIYGERVLLLLSAAAAPPGWPSVLPPFPGGCQEAVDVTQLAGLLLLPTQVVSTPVPLSLAWTTPAAIGLEAHVQAIVFDQLPYAWPPYQGLSNALRLVVGQ